MQKVIYKETLDGENLIEYGDEVDYFYLIKKGKVQLYNKTFDYMYDLGEGSFFGEQYIMLGMYSDSFYKSIKSNNENSIS